MRLSSSLISCAMAITVRWNSITSVEKTSIGPETRALFFSNACRARSMLRSGCSRVVMIIRSVMAKCSQPRFRGHFVEAALQIDDRAQTISGDTDKVACASRLVSACTASGAGRECVRADAAPAHPTGPDAARESPVATISASRSVSGGRALARAAFRQESRVAQTKPGMFGDGKLHAGDVLLSDTLPGQQ